MTSPDVASCTLDYSRSHLETTSRICHIRDTKSLAFMREPFLVESLKRIALMDVSPWYLRVGGVGWFDGEEGLMRRYGGAVSAKWSIFCKIVLVTCAISSKLSDVTIANK